MKPPPTAHNQSISAIERVAERAHLGQQLGEEPKAAESNIKPADEGEEPEGEINPNVKREEEECKTEAATLFSHVPAEAQKGKQTKETNHTASKKGSPPSLLDIVASLCKQHGVPSGRGKDHEKTWKQLKGLCVSLRTFALAVQLGEEMLSKSSSTKVRVNEEQAFLRQLALARMACASTGLRQARHVLWNGYMQDYCPAPSK